MPLFQPSTMHHPTAQCGCRVYIDNTWKYLPQVSLNAHATIFSSVSRTKLTQTFVNPTDFILQEVSYKFPLYDGVSVVGFECQVGTRLLHSKVKPKEQANTDYKNAIERDESAAIMDHSDTEGDVFTIRLGNVPAKEKVTVDITFVGELKQDAQIDGIRYTLPNSIAPRYGNTWDFSQQQRETSGFPVTLDGISITVDILLEKTSVIRELQSTSHSPKVSLGRISSTSSTSNVFEPSQASATLRLHKGNQPLLERDFVLVVKADGLDIPRALLESHPHLSGQRALMATLVPKFNLPINKPEIVFVIDRSGSMQDKIMTLREALKVFLKSLPTGVCFNICSFGNSHSFLWPRSTVYDNTSLNHALKFLNTVQADMGGTEMQSAVEATVLSRLPNRDLEVLLLTDGEIYDQGRLFNFVRKSSSSHNARFFSLGIGYAASHSLIEGIARAGQGFSQSVLKDEELDRCVVRMLKGALTPHIYDYKLEVDYENTVANDFEIVSETEASMSDTDTEVQGASLPNTPAPAQPIPLFSHDFIEPDTTPGSEVTQADTVLPKISAPKVIQAPHKIPPLYPFIRTTVYLLLDPESSDRIPRSLTFSATSKQGPLCLRIPITDLGQGETIHQLASRKAVVELEELHGWLGDSKDEVGNSFAQLHHETKEKVAARECQHLGIKYQVTGKYCSFVALENTTVESSEGLTERSVDESHVKAPLTIMKTPSASHPVMFAYVGRPRVHHQQHQQQSQVHRESFLSANPTGLFGHPAPPPPPSSRALFGGGPTASASSGGLFGAGSTQPPPQLASGGLFGSVSTSSPSPSGGLFGAGSTQPPPPLASRGLFGGAPPPPPPAPSGSAASPPSMSAFGAPPSVPFAASSLGGQVNRQVDGTSPPQITKGKKANSDMDSFPVIGSASQEYELLEEEIPTSKVHALIELQKFDGSWNWEEKLFNVLGVGMEEIRTKIANMLQNDGMRSTMSGREANVIATLIVMGLLKREHYDTKETWELVYDKADEWVHQEMLQVPSDIVNAYDTDVWMSLK